MFSKLSVLVSKHMLPAWSKMSPWKFTGVSTGCEAVLDCRAEGRRELPGYPAAELHLLWKATWCWVSVPDSSHHPPHLAPLFHLDQTQKGPKPHLTCRLWDDIGLQLWGETRDTNRWSVRKQVTEEPPHHPIPVAQEPLPWAVLPAFLWPVISCTQAGRRQPQVPYLWLERTVPPRPAPRGPAPRGWNWCSSAAGPPAHREGVGALAPQEPVQAPPGLEAKQA